MSAVSFIAGAVCAVAGLVLLLPWLRTIPRLATLPALPWPAGAGALIVMVVTIVLLRATTVAPSEPVATAVTTGSAPIQNQWSDVAAALSGGVTATGSAGSAPAAARAGSMDAAIAALQARLAKSGGSNDDWELLAKSYDFLQRPKEAAQARAHQLPPAVAVNAAPAAGAAAAVQSGVDGEVTLAAGLMGRAPVGTTMFIVAKSVDSPGAPVAVVRSNVGSWPVKFEMNDSQAMLPGRTLSSVGRVTIEARISQKGQPLATPGDLQGVSGIINPRDRKPVKIVIDKVIS